MKYYVLREIVKEVNEKGFHYVPLDLLKPVFGCDGKQNTCVEERLLTWALENQILYEYKEVGRFTVVKFLGRGGEGGVTNVTVL